jgi:CRISPR-associated endonuclease/helicase Cas3
VHRALLYRKDKIEIVKDMREIRPGSLLVVPSEIGGIGPHKTWDPMRKGSEHTIQDWGDAAQLLQRGRATLRFDAKVIAPWLQVDAGAIGKALEHEGEEISAADRVRENVAWIAERSDKAPPWLRATARLLSTSARPVHVGGGSEPERWLATGRRRVSAAELRGLLEQEGELSADSLATEMKGEVTSMWEDGSFTLVEIPLDHHLRGVRDSATAMAQACHLAPELVSAVRWAGWVHDIGKRDPRFQCMLHAGDPVAALAAERAGFFLAKSALPWQSRQDRRRARHAAGYPAGQRHELVSLDMAEGSSDLEAAVRFDGADWELVLHLVGSHHGLCRPFVPAVELLPEADERVAWRHVMEDDGAIELTGHTRHQRGRLGSGAADRFWALVRRYGWYELAWLEALVRLADHRQSEREQEGKPT